MKPPIVRLMGIAFAMCFIIFHSCQDSGVDKALGKTRVDVRQDCSNCDCTCFVQLNNDNAASLQLCGTCEGPQANCMGEDVCMFGDFTGDGHTFSLSTLNPRYDFCELIETGFWILAAATIIAKESNPQK